jgi:hypothetical protein
MSKPFGTYDYVPRVRKVKHVKFFSQYCGYDGTVNTCDLEKAINDFADKNPSFKILGVRIEGFKDSMIAVVTYLENAKDGFTGEEDYYGADEETDSD